MRGNLLNNQYSDYEAGGGQFASLGIENQRSNGFWDQRKSIKSWFYYGLMSLVTLLIILCIIFAAGWSAANNSDKDHHVPQQDLPNVLLPVVPSYSSDTLMGQIKTYDLIDLLSGIYRIAMNNNGNRDIAQTGNNATVEYLLEKIATTTNLVNVERTYFLRKVNSSISDASFTMTIDGSARTTVDPSQWQALSYSQSISNSTSSGLIYVENACDSSRWPLAPEDSFWIISRYNSDCTVTAKAVLAEKYGATGFIVPSVQTTPTRGSVPWYVNIGAIGLTEAQGETLLNAVTAGSDVNIWINFREQHADVTMSNVCGDTPGGDPTSVVMVGGHSDGVSRGPGVNDDGSGSITTLVLAMGVTKLMNSGTYNLPNMIKFCFLSGEEAGLLGSKELVRVGLIKNNDPDARVGSRAKDWAVMIDLDMLGSLNFMNHIYDANQLIPKGTPVTAVNGSQTMTNLFFEFFQQNNLPADSEEFDGRSDYGPFLEVGIPSGGVNAGADKIKSEADRERYQRMTGWGGIADVQLDQCYHKSCDTIANIHWGVYTNMSMSSAYVLEKFALRQNLRQWINYTVNEQMPDPRGHVAFDFRSRSAHQVEADDVY